MGRTRGIEIGWEVAAITRLEMRSNIVPRGPRQKGHTGERDEGLRVGTVTRE